MSTILSNIRLKLTSFYCSNSWFKGTHVSVLSLSLSLFSRVSFPSPPTLVPTCTIVFLRELSGRILLVLPSSPDVYVHEWCSEDFSYRHAAFPEIQPKNIAFFHVAPERATIPTSTLIFSLFSNTLVIFPLELKIIVITILPLVSTIRLFLSTRLNLLQHVRSR